MPHIADDRLSAFVHRDVLHRDLLLASGSVALEGFDLRRKGPCKLVERALGAILLRNSFHTREPTRECHGHQLDGGLTNVSTVEIAEPAEANYPGVRVQRCS
jgi:hypothetical protein